ncbi:hypothetical protein CH063_04763, partial [Colletotrichum higginsianum]
HLPRRILPALGTTFPTSPALYLGDSGQSVSNGTLTLSNTACCWFLLDSPGLFDLQEDSQCLEIERCQGTG